MSSSTEDCIFCNKTNCKVISSTKHFFIIRDTAYPVTKHHTLIITHRHVDDYFDLNKEEINDLDEILKNQKRELKQILVIFLQPVTPSLSRLESHSLLVPGIILITYLWLQLLPLLLLEIQLF